LMRVFEQFAFGGAAHVEYQQIQLPLFPLEALGKEAFVVMA
jgi:hypothetical protein